MTLNNFCLIKILWITYPPVQVKIYIQTEFYVFFFYHNRAFSFHPTSEEAIRVIAGNSRKERKKENYDNCDNDGKNTRRKPGRAEIQSVLTPIQTTRWKFLPRSRGRLSTFRSRGSSRIRSSYFFSTHFRGDDPRAREFSLFSVDRAASASDTLRSPSPSNTRACRFRTLPKRIWLIALLLKQHWRIMVISANDCWITSHSRFFLIQRPSDVLRSRFFNCVCWVGEEYWNGKIEQGTCDNRLLLLLYYYYS